MLFSFKLHRVESWVLQRQLAWPGDSWRGAMASVSSGLAVLSPAAPLCSLSDRALPVLLCLPRGQSRRALGFPSPTPSAVASRENGSVGTSVVSATGTQALTRRLHLEVLFL